jgi:hypothetical protein
MVFQEILSSFSHACILVMMVSFDSHVLDWRCCSNESRDEFRIFESMFEFFVFVVCFVAAQQNAKPVDTSMAATINIKVNSFYV